MTSSPILICFAVREEAKYFHATPGRCETIVTGMGPKNAAAAIRQALVKLKPRLVITAGFAGALSPDLATGSVVFEEDEDAGLREKLIKCGAQPATFHCAECVATLATEKQVLRQLTHADAVEMESGVIRAICREVKIPSATIRVISDAADEDLPLDFNALMTSRQQINFAKLAWEIICHPGKIPELMRFQKHTKFAAQRLGDALQKTLA